jgi:DNA-binding NtrC family response regulator
MKIMVVDDEGIVLDSCRRVLEADGFQVLLVTSADKALTAIQDQEPALLLIDIKMPEHDGMYLMREVKEKWPDIPIIVMSGYHTAETVKEAVKMGATTFIAKPFTPDELLETLRQVIQKKESPGN